MSLYTPKTSVVSVVVAVLTNVLKMNLQKNDIGKRILETKKQTENLKMELLNLIDGGIKCTVECIKLEAVKTIKCDSKHSQHKGLCSKPKATLISNHKAEEEQQIIIESRRNTRSYDLNDAQDVIKKKCEKLSQQVRLHKNEKIKRDLQTRKLLELHKKSLEFVRRDIQAKRQQQSNLLKKPELKVELEKKIQRNNCSKEMYYQSRSSLNSKKNYEQAKTVKESKNILFEVTEQTSPKSLIISLPECMLKAKKTRKSNSNVIKKQIVSKDKLSIVSEYNIEKNLRNVHKHFLEQMNLVDLHYSKTRKDTEENTEDKNCRIPENKIFDYKFVPEDKEQNNIILQNFKGTNLMSLVTNWHELNDAVSNRTIHNYLEKSELSTVARKTDNLYKNTEKSTKRKRVTNKEITHPVCLQEKLAQGYPLNFINTVKRKLQDAVKLPETFREILSENATNGLADGMIGLSRHSMKLISENESFISLKCLSLDSKTCTNFQLIPDKYSIQSLVSVSESESATSKNIPDISSENSNNSSLIRNTSFDKQNDSKLNIDVISNMLLTHPHKVKIDISILDTEINTFNSIINPTSINHSKVAILKSNTTEFNNTELLEGTKNTDIKNCHKKTLEYRKINPSMTSLSNITEMYPLKESTLLLSISNEEVKTEFETKKVMKNNDGMHISSVFDKSIVLGNLDSLNDIHLKVKGEIDLLNGFNQSFRQFSPVEQVICVQSTL